MTSAFAFLFGPAVYAAFTRTVLTPCGYSYGYGYDTITGYGYGYGYGATCESSSSTVAPSVTVALPNGGQTLNAGSTYDIVWSQNGTGYGSTRLSYSTDNGMTWTVITTSATGGFYMWTVPNVNTMQALIKAEAMNGSTVGATDTSDATFTIVGESSGGGGSSGGTVSGGTGTSTTGTTPEGPSAAGGFTREQANSILPVTVPVDSLVKIADDSAVYYVGFDAKRHPFPTLQIYESWYPDFSQVQVIDAATLANIPLGSSILVRPGTFWVKISSDPKTYYVEPGYVLRWIEDEDAAVTLGGPNWNKNIIDVDPSLFTGFTTGADISSTYLQSAWPAGSVVTSGGSVQPWYVDATGRRQFNDQAAMTANLFQSKFIVTTGPDAGWTHLTVENPIAGLEDGLFSQMH
jgi:hypothetical protein